MDQYSEEEVDSNEEIFSESEETPNKKIKLDEPTGKYVKYENINEESTKKNRKKSKNDLYKAPTVEELNQLKETENLFNNNLYRLQIEELINEVQIKNKRKKYINDFLKNFGEFINFLKSFEPISVNLIRETYGSELLDKIIKNAEIVVESDQEIQLKLLKPCGWESFGLFVNNCQPGPEILLNINIRAPKECFLNKDFLNNRYLVKKSYYLSYIAENLRKFKKVNCNIKKSCYEGNKLNQILILEPKDCNKILIRVFVTPFETFKFHRFLPDRNNVKIDLFSDSGSNLGDYPTIYYNSTLAFDVTLASNIELIKLQLNEKKSYQDALKLIKIWMSQRELNTGFGYLTDEIITYFIIYLNAKGLINKLMSSYQIVRIFWNFIKSQDSLTISISDTSNDVLNQFKSVYDVVLLDSTGSFNTLSFMTNDIYKKIQNECELALKHLDDSKISSFQSLFILKHPFYLQFDAILDLTAEKLIIKEDIQDAEKAKYIGFDSLLVQNQITSFLKRGLNERVLYLVPKFLDNKLMFGINLNPDKAFNFMELGPNLNEFKEAEEFRKFWGSLSSDRRFRDGTSKVAVYFKSNTIKSKRDIISKIIKHVIGDKLKLKFHLHYNEFEDVICNKRIIPPYPLGTNEEATLKVITISDELGKLIRSLDMSLSITGLQGITDIYCFTEIFPPISQNHALNESIGIKGENMILNKSEFVPDYIKPVECVLQLEHSSKWPDHLEMVRQLKTSFYLEMAKLLAEKHKILSHVTKEYFDVFYKGLIFRYYLYLPKEISLLKKNYDETGFVSYKNCDEASEIEKNLNVIPKIISNLKGLQSQYPSYGPGTALIKRWLNCQLIDDFHFPEIVVDLLSASLYLNESAYNIPNTPQICFLRFLKFFADLQWDLQPVLLNFNNELSTEDITSVESQIQQNRSAFPSLFIITPQDKCQSIFTKENPSAPILRHVKTLALSMLKFFNEKVMERNFLDIRSMFIPNLDGFNILIHLKPEVNSRKRQQIKLGPSVELKQIEKFTCAEDNKKIPIVDFDPIKLYLNDLRDNYGEFATFFHNRYGGELIGVIWNPESYVTKEFKVTNVKGRKLNQNNELIVNKEAILEDFYTLGADLVKEIEVK